MKDARIQVFNKWWWFYVCLTLFVLWAVSTAANRFTEDVRYRILLFLGILELVILRLYKHSLKHIRDDYNYFNELPCYLCNQSTLLCIAAALNRNTTVMAYCVSVGTLGAVLAFLMPDRYNRNQRVFSAQAYGFYGYHGLLIVSCMSFYTMGLYEPKLTDCVWPAVWTLILAAAAHLVNAFLRKTGLNEKSNYVFTYGPENAILDKMYSWFPHKLVYMLPVLPVFTAYSFVFLGILKLLR